MIQDAYRLFYKDKHERLPDRLNWKPYWGWRDRAEILQFHGAKPSYVEHLLAHSQDESEPTLYPLFGANAPAYRRYLGEWNLAAQDYQQQSGAPKRGLHWLKRFEVSSALDGGQLVLGHAFEPDAPKEMQSEDALLADGILRLQAGEAQVGGGMRGAPLRQITVTSGLTFVLDMLSWLGELQTDWRGVAV